MALQWIAVLILYFFPQIILVLPNMMFGDEVGSSSTHEGGDNDGTQKVSEVGSAASRPARPRRPRRRSAQARPQSAGSCRAPTPRARRT